ncbi:MAG TPA: HAD family hydrolase [bacterium]|nr:HAD family hydrolase [bacterium]
MRRTSPFDLLLLDLNGTFMFGQDRFGGGEDYARTYREAGGTTLADGDVTAAVSAVVERLTVIGRREDRLDSFPAVLECLRALPLTRSWPDSELRRIEQVVASHELGRIPAEYASFVSSLAETYRLGLVSNLWSRKDPWLAELDRAGVTEAFDWLIFSSDGASVKPSPRIFQPIFDDWDGPRDRILMIGDSLRRDVAGARNVGIRSLWIGGRDAEDSSASPVPDYRVADLLDARWLQPAPAPEP